MASSTSTTTHERVFDEAADGTGDHADRGADHEADGHGDHRRSDRVGGAVDDAGEHVAAGRVGAEPVRGARAPAGRPRPRRWGSAR